MTNPDRLDGPLALPAAGGAPSSLVILLHGYGSNGDDLIGLAPYWRDALPHTLFIAPNAPQRCPGAPGGYQWWPLTSLTPAARAAGVREPAPALNAFIDQQLERHGLAEVAFACGYQSASAFSTAFTRTVGCSPARYAAERRAEAA